MIETGRLRLRRWELRDLTPYAALNADPLVMDFPRPLTTAETADEIADFEARWERDGFCFAAVESKSEGKLIGMAGIARCHLDVPICPCVEIGWRLDRAHWGFGYASEAARAWLDHGLDKLGIGEIVAFTDPANRRSLAVMRRIGMVPAPDRDFEHPDVPAGHPLRPHRVFVASRSSCRE